MAKKTAVVWGYFLKNLGDDLMLQAFLNAAKGKYEKIYINTFQKYEKFYSGFGVTAVSQDSFVQRAANHFLRKLGLPQLYFRLTNKNTDFIILGGSLFIESQDAQNDRQRMIDLEYAIDRSDRAYVIGSNFGVYSSEWYAEGYRNIFRKCTDVCFRDKYSWELFSDLKNTRFAPDVVLSGLWERNRENECAPNENYVLISAMNFHSRPKLKNAADRYEKTLAQIAMYHIGQGDRVGLIGFCEQEGDSDACKRIMDICGSEKIEMIEYHDLGMVSVISHAKKIYGTRFHSIMLALYYGIPCLPFVYDQKTANALAAYCGAADGVSVRDAVDAEKIVRMPADISLMDGIRQSAKSQFESVY